MLYYSQNKSKKSVNNNNLIKLVVSIVYENAKHFMYLYRYAKSKNAPAFQTAGFGGFAGRAFKKDEVVLENWKTLYLPKNFPNRQSLKNYVFAYNKTHMALILDYGSVCNHHKSANVEAVYKLASKDVYFQVHISVRSYYYVKP